MAKAANKATRKLLKKGKLNFTSRAQRQSKVKGQSGQVGKYAKALGGKVKGRDKPHRKQHGGKPPHGKGKGAKNAEGEAGEEQERPQRKRLPSDLSGIENLDVDAFMRGDFFNGSGDDEHSEEDRDEDEEDQPTDDDEDEDEEEEEEEQEGGEGTEGKAKPLDGGKKKANDDDDDEEEDEDDGDDEDEDEENGSSSDEDLGKIKNEVQKHKAELEKLKEKDPEFFKFLEKTESRLLDFGKDEDEEDDEEVEGEHEEDTAEDGKPSKTRQAEEDEEAEDLEEEEEEEQPVRDTVELTLGLLQKLEQSAIEKHSLKGLRRLISAFQSASDFADESKDPRKASQGPAYSISSSSVFDRLMTGCLSNLPDVFAYHILRTASVPSGEPSEMAKKIMASPALKSLKPSLYRFFKALLLILQQVTESNLLTFILSSVERSIPFLLPFARLSKKFLKGLLQSWSTSEAPSVKLAAFLRIRQMAVVMPFPFIEDCLKGIYLAYARAAKFVSEPRLDAMAFMTNCVVELYGLDMASSYQHAFVYLRQLALHLRSAYIKKSSEALQKVYSWQYLSCLRVWARVIAAYPAEDQLRELLFPLVQITLGLLRLVPSAKYYPLVFHGVALLQELAAETQTFIPCTNMLLGVLENQALHKKPKPTSQAVPSLHLTIKLGKDLLEPRNIQEAVVVEALELLSHEVAIYRTTLGFPEYMFPVKERLRKFLKSVKPARWRTLAKGLVDEIERRSALVVKERAKREMAPTDEGSFEAILLPKDPLAKERLGRLLEEKMARIKHLLQKDSEAAVARKKGEEEEEDDDDDEEEEEEDDEEEEEGDERPTEQGKRPTSPMKSGEDGSAPKRRKGQDGGQEVNGALVEMPDKVGSLEDWSDDDGGGQGEGEEEEEDQQEEDEEDEDENDEEEESEEEEE